MERRNFLSGLFASPLALKARFLALFRKRSAEFCVAPMRPVELCGAAIFGGFSPGGFERYTRPSRWQEQLAYFPEPDPRFTIALARAACSRPRGHEGPHMLLNPR